LHLEKALIEFKRIGMTLKMKQWFFTIPVVLFLGHIVGSGEISVVSGKITAIKQPPEPSKKKKLLGSFCGLCNYYRNIFLLVSGTAVPVTKLAEGGKGAASSSQNVSDFSKPFQCDASAYAIGCWLSLIDSHFEQ